MPNSIRLKVTPHEAAAAIWVCIGLFAIYILANVFAHVWVYGFITERFIPDLISSIVLHRLK
jgi:hypothetical protein